MGSAASVVNKPRCPYHRMCEAQIRKAKKTHYIDGEASEFYFHCSNGDIDQVRQILEAPDQRSINELVKFERNGDTALHVATAKGHDDIVKLLLEHKCSRIILNRSGKVASEEATTPAMQKLFIRSDASDRFHESDTTRTMAHYLPNDNGAGATSNGSNTTNNGSNTANNESNTANNESNTTNNGSNTANNESNTANNESNTTNNGINATSNATLEFFKGFDTEEEVYEHSLNHQTMAMWLKFYNWFSRTFPSFFQRDNLNLDSFDLHKNNDFKFFLQKKLGERYQETLDAFNNAQAENSIEPLLTIYSSERYGFYRSLNRQLADSPAEADTSPHLCDRFIIEFHIRGDELEKRSFIGTVYRGATMNLSEVSLYEKVCENKPRGVIVFKAFTSTSEDKDVALGFIIGNPPKEHQTGVLFIIEIKVKSPTIIGISNVSEYKDEQEILFMPGNLFVVKKIVKDVITYTKYQKSVKLTEIHLEYLHIPVSFWKKLSHTYRSAKKNSVT